MSVPASAAAPANPLFYKNPQVLVPQVHGEWRLKGGNAAFAAAAIGVPVVITECADLGRFYPVLFGAGKDFGPIALTGLIDRNLFIQDDLWDQSTYIPAYVRRYPFGLATVPDDKDRLVLVIDEASNLFVQGGTEGAALFEGSEASQLTKDALQFCENWHRETFATQAFCDALREKNLLVDRRVDGTLPDGKKFAIDGFQIIDSKKLSELDSETVTDWHRRGWLAACYYHLSSLARIGDLVARTAKPVATAS